MELLLNKRWKREICPFCKDGFEQGETLVCEGCNTTLHQECFEENGGCAVPGCHEKSDDWPTCSQCDERLAKLSAVICIQCGYDQENNRQIDSANDRIDSSRDGQGRKASRFALDRPSMNHWGLTHSSQKSAITNTILPLLVLLNAFGWLGVAVFGFLTFVLFLSSPFSGELKFTFMGLVVSLILTGVTTKLLSKKS